MRLCPVIGHPDPGRPGLALEFFHHPAQFFVLVRKEKIQDVLIHDAGARGKVPIERRPFLLIEGTNRLVFHLSVPHNQDVVLRLIDEILHFPLIQKRRQLPDRLRFKIGGPEDLPLLHVEEDRPVRRDHRQLQFHIGQQLPHRGRGLDRRYRKLASVLNQAVQFDLRVAGDLLSHAENRILDSGDKEYVRVSQSRQMGPVHELRRSNADDGVHGPVKHKDIGIRVPDMVDGDGEEDNRGKIGHVLDLEQDGGIDHHRGDQTDDQIMHHLVRDGVFPDAQRDQQRQQAPGRSDKSADHTPSGDRMHAAVILLNTLKSRDCRVEGHPVFPAQLIDRKAQQHRRQRAENPLSRQRDWLPGVEIMIHSLCSEAPSTMWRLL